MKRLIIMLWVLAFNASTLAEELSLPERNNTVLQTYALQYAQANDIDIAYRDLGASDAPVVIMIMGLGASHKLWGDQIPFSLVDAGYRVLLFDNRDVADSTSFAAEGDPVIWWELLKDFFGFEVSSLYDLNDMADDTLGLMDALDISRAHIVGASMGGMIAQVVASHHPDRVQSLVSIMSSPGFGDHLPMPSQQSNDQLRGLAEGDADKDRVARLHALGLYPESMPRQIMAILKSGDRQDDVREIRAPTLVIHGELDTLIPPAHGEFTAELIPDSRYISFPGMGHNLPEEVIPDVLANMITHFSSSQAREI